MKWGHIERTFFSFDTPVSTDAILSPQHAAWNSACLNSCAIRQGRLRFLISRRLYCSWNSYSLQHGYKPCNVWFVRTRCILSRNIRLMRAHKWACPRSTFPQNVPSVMTKIFLFRGDAIQRKSQINRKRLTRIVRSGKIKKNSINKSKMGAVWN